MATKEFKDINFTLPKKDRLNVAHQIGVDSGNAWYERKEGRQGAPGCSLLP